MHLSIKNHFLESTANKIRENDNIRKVRRHSHRSMSNSKSDDVHVDSDTIPYIMLVSFLIISFGYMLPWTSLGSLISYYKYRYGASFYVKIYCAYYLPGLPVALVQYQYDEFLNNLYGSKNAYKWRGFICFVVMVTILLCLSWVVSEIPLIFMFALLGMASWLCHGTATMYASLFPRAAVAYLQIGFRCPELFAIVADHFLDLGMDATAQSLDLFYKITASLLACSLICWVLLVESNISTVVFEDKDRRGRAVEDDLEKTPLLSTSTSTTSTSTTNTSTSTTNPIQRARLLLSAMDSFVQRDQLFHSSVSPLCAALFITMWSSIFQASFFAYVNAVSSETKNLEQRLYFIRLICDLVGRPLTFLPRPFFLQTNNELLIASILRSLMLIVFFTYISVPSFPQSDTFICVLVGIFSTASGYLVVLIYEHAASVELTKSERAHATNVLNIAFQFAAFMAVIMSVAISMTGWLI